MSPRPRAATDEDILAAAFRAVSRLGPVRLTLADVAREAGLSPATLVQRFGSKRGLLLALTEQTVDGVADCFAALRAAHPSPLAALVASAAEMARCATTPEQMANHLAFLQIELADADFRRVTLEHSRRLLAGYAALLDEAVAAGELAPCDTARLARALSALSGGSLIGWAIHGEGTAEGWVRNDLETLLAPYRLATRRNLPSGKAGKKRGSAHCRPKVNKKVRRADR
jgi:AcrR family transcriptional regulator